MTNLARILALALLALLVPSLGYASDPPEKPTGSSQIAVEALRAVIDDDCRGVGVGPALIGAEELIQRLKSETLTVGDAVRMAKQAKALRCNLSPEARSAFDSLWVEAGVRRLDATSVGSEDRLVTPHIDPEAWNALMTEGEHQTIAGSAQAKIDPISFGCAGAIIVATGTALACINDADTERTKCMSGWICPEGKIPNLGCCDDLYALDAMNCILSAGMNGHDNDYDICCR